MRWLRHDKAELAGRLKAGERPDLAMTTAIGPLDELLALHDELGSFEAVSDLENERERAWTTAGWCARWPAYRSWVIKGKKSP